MADGYRRGEALDWAPCEAPGGERLRGEHVLVRPVDAKLDAAPLYAASHPPEADAAIWTYMFDGPYASVEEMRRVMEWEEGIDETRSSSPWPGSTTRRRWGGPPTSASRPSTA